MGYQARWGPKGFIVSSSKIAAIEGLTTSYELKKDVNEDTSGTPPTNTKGMELQPVNLSVKYLRGTGTDPRGQLKEWKAQVGNAYPLYIGGTVFGPPKLQLQKVDVSDVLLDNSGAMIACTVSLSFMEYSPTSKSNAAGSTKKATAYSVDELSALSGNSKAAALSAKPSTDDKSTKKPTSTGGTRRPR